MNKQIIGGIIITSVECHKTAEQRSVMNIIVRTNDLWIDKSGNRHDKSNTHKLTIWDNAAEIIEKKYKKGDYILVVGRSETIKHNNIPITECVVSHVENIIK